MDKATYECPECGSRLRGQSGREGTRCTCPACRKVVTLVLPLDDNDEDEVDYQPRRRRRHEDKAWSGWVVAIMMLLTLGIPLLGIILGIIDMGNEGPRRRQGAAFVAVGLVSMLVYALALAS